MLQKKRRQTRHLPAFILLALAQEPRHGGAIHDALASRLPGLKIDTGAIYRALKALEAEGAVSFVWDASASGPARKIYHMTDKGWQSLASWKEEIENRREILSDFLAAYARLSRP